MTIEGATGATLNVGKRGAGELQILDGAIVRATSMFVGQEGDRADGEPASKSAKIK